MTNPWVFGAITLSTLAIDHWLKQPTTHPQGGGTYYLPDNEPSGPRIEPFPATADAAPRALTTPALDPSQLNLTTEGYAIHTPSPWNLLPIGIPQNKIDGTVPDQNIHAPKPSDFVYLSESNSDGSELQRRREKFNKRLDRILSSDSPAQDKVNKLVDIETKYDALKKHFNDQDSDAYRHLVETTDKVHTIIGIIVNHQSNARAAMRRRYGVSIDDDHFDSRWYEKNPIAQAEHLALNHRQYDTKAVLDLGEAILRDIKDVADRSKDRSVALPDVFETIERRKDLMKKFLGE